MFRALALIPLIAVLLTSCAAPSRPASDRQIADRQGADRQTAAPAAFPVIPPNFADVDPVDWPLFQSPASHMVHGIDASVWQGTVDWPTARANGVNFAYLKATEGGDRVDAGFALNWRAAAAAGVPRAGYHFFYHCGPAAAQARWFITHVPRDPAALPPALDMEWTPQSPTCPDKRPASDIRRDAQTWLNLVAAHYDRRPLLYTTVDFYEENEMWRLSGVDFWLRSTAAHPSDTYSGQHWLIWQYSSTGRVPGISGNVDLNVFSGGPAAFSAWVAGG